MKKGKTKKVKLILIFVVAFFLILFLFPNQIDRSSQIESRIMITTLGLDREKDNIVLSVAMAIPNAQKETGTHSEVIYARGINIASAIEKLNQVMGKKVDFGHCTMLIIGDSLARHSTLEELKFLLSSGTIAPGCAIMTSPRDARDFLIENNALTKFSGKSTSAFVNYNNKSNNVAVITLLDFLSNTYSHSHATYAPYIDIIEDTEGGAVITGAVEEGSDGKRYMIDGISIITIFTKGKAVAVLTEEQTKGVGWLDRRSQKGIVVSDQIEYNGKTIDNISANIVKKNASIKTSFVNNIPRAELCVSLDLQILDNHTMINEWMNAGTDSKKVSDTVNTAFKKRIASDINETAKVSKQIQTDILLVAQNMYKYNTKEFLDYLEKNESIIKQLEYDINVEVKVIG